ncbi:MAG: radical SAM protein [Nanoarchaeota archaeon]|nr:radical SAM protein [Nanoarchaeota archaeon]
MTYISFVLTRKCNLRCGHCYIEGGPEHANTTISEENFKRIIDHLPNKRINLVLTGGEVFTIKDKLFNFLTYIKSINKDRKEKNQIDVTVQTNAYWAKNEKMMESNLSDLSSLGVKSLDVTSDDPNHFEEGIDPDSLKRLDETLFSSEFFDDYIIRGVSLTESVPLGRAKGKIPEKCNRHLKCIYAIKSGSITIREDGKVYPCCYSIFPIKGNLIEQPLTKILKQSRRDKRLAALNRGGIKKLALVDGYSKKNLEKLISEYDECGFCMKYYST